ncbi:hypothetical protein [Pseudonocardia spinosispora]|uniref:hypothetical protein n=1 Tax=Pseudonocardia spinosispora TaxID=103441 RepID=UPI00146F9A4B|nr:hypothetical protein [Pseudonocardia spinosispora]
MTRDRVRLETLLMACCIAMALVIAWVRSAWSRLVPGARQPPETPFAPPARRAGPDRSAHPTPLRTP